VYFYPSPGRLGFPQPRALDVFVNIEGFTGHITVT
jgi:hypothetical protein